MSHWTVKSLRFLFARKCFRSIARPIEGVKFMFKRIKTAIEKKSQENSATNLWLSLAQPLGGEKILMRGIFHIDLISCLSQS